jgi:hypothetical protein
MIRSVTVGALKPLGRMMTDIGFTQIFDSFNMMADRFNVP